MVELEPRTLVSGIVVGESPRWHDGRLSFANWGGRPRGNIYVNDVGFLEAKS